MDSTIRQLGDWLVDFGHGAAYRYSGKGLQFQVWSNRTRDTEITTMSLHRLPRAIQAILMQEYPALRIQLKGRTQK